MVKTLYFDESGYSGRALLDPEQPYFVVASADVGEQEASEVLAECFPAFQGRELKFQNLWRRPGNRAGFLSLSSKLEQLQDRIFLWCTDKKFCVLTKLIDHLIEPIFNDMGYDFYAGAFAPKFSNYVYMSIMAFGSPELYVSTIEAYSAFSRNPSAATLAELRRRLHLMAKNVPQRLRWFYGMAAAGADQFERHHNFENFDDTFEIQLSSVLVSVGYWRSRTEDDLRILHDASNNFFRQQALWDQVTSPDVPEQIHPAMNGPPLQFPLRVVETVACDSAEHRSIQFCDLLAGLIAKVHRTPRDEAEAATRRDLIVAGLGELTVPGIRPHDDMPDGPPQLRDGPDAVDMLMGIMYPGR